MAPVAISAMLVPMVMSGYYPPVGPQKQIFGDAPQARRRSRPAGAGHAPQAPVTPRRRRSRPRGRDGADSAADLAQFALDLARHLAPANRLALVVEVLALRQRQLHLGPGAGAGEVHAGRHERQPSLLRAADQPLDLGPVQQQLARPLGVMV